MSEAAINTTARRAYAEVLRRFIAGGLTTDQYECAAGRLAARHGRDGGADAVFDAVWFLYDDVWPHRMTGKYRLNAAMRSRIARWILFLRSDRPLAGAPGAAAEPAARTPGFVRRALGHAVRWTVSGVLIVLAGLFGAGGEAAAAAVFGLAAVFVFTSGFRGAGLGDPVYERALAGGPEDPWPFASSTDLTIARGVPTFLNGGR